MALWTVPKIWDGGECFIIGGGTSIPREFGVPETLIDAVVSGREPVSAYSPYLSVLFNKHTIGINNAYKLGDWLSVLFFGDCSYYVQRKQDLYYIRYLKVSCCDRFAKPDNLCEGIKYTAKDRQKSLGISENPSTVCWNNNSGLAAISLARHLGVKRIILLGFDMCLDQKRVSHFFGSHLGPGRKATPPPFARHMKGIPRIAEDAQRLGLEILNCSGISAIPSNLIKKVSLKEVL